MVQELEAVARMGDRTELPDSLRPPKGPEDPRYGPFRGMLFALPGSLALWGVIGWLIYYRYG